MALLKINRRTYFINADTITVTKDRPGHFTVKMDERIEFKIEGGRESGGSARDWFVYEPRLYGDRWLPVNSMIEAIKMGAQY